MYNSQFTIASPPNHRKEIIFWRLRRLAIVHCALLFLLLLSGNTYTFASSAESLNEIITQAIEAEKADNNLQAIAFYKKAIAISTAENPSLYYNLANLFLNNNIPEAIFYYRKTLELKPNFTPAQQNLKIARQVVIDNAKYKLFLYNQPLNQTSLLLLPTETFNVVTITIQFIIIAIVIVICTTILLIAKHKKIKKIFYLINILCGIYFGILAINLFFVTRDRFGDISFSLPRLPNISSDKICVTKNINTNVFANKDMTQATLILDAGIELDHCEIDADNDSIKTVLPDTIQTVWINKEDICDNF